jgi:hypothetical protein
VRLIGETEKPGVPNIVNATSPDDEDGLKDLNPPAAINDDDCGPDKTQDIDQPIVKTIEQTHDPIEELTVHENCVQVQDPNEQFEPHLLQPPEHTDTKVVIQEQLSIVAHNALVLNHHNDSFHLLVAPNPMKALLPSTSSILFTLKNTKIKIASSWLTVS